MDEGCLSPETMSKLYVAAMDWDECMCENEDEYCTVAKTAHRRMGFNRETKKYEYSRDDAIRDLRVITFYDSHRQVACSTQDSMLNKLWSSTDDSDAAVELIPRLKTQQRLTQPQTHMNATLLQPSVRLTPQHHCLSPPARRAESLLESIRHKPQQYNPGCCVLLICVVYSEPQSRGLSQSSACLHRSSPSDTASLPLGLLLQFPRHSSPPDPACLGQTPPSECF